MFNLSLFAERLQDLMLEDELTSKAFAQKLNIAKSSINMYLAGTHIPSTHVLIEIADYFNCPTDFLLGVGEDFERKEYQLCPPFSERFKFILINNNCSQYKLNKETKISETLITHWIRGEYTPSVDNLIKLAEFFNCSVDYLLGRID